MSVLPNSSVRQWLRAAVAIATITGGLIACTSTTELEPAASATQPAGQPDTAIDRVDGIRAVVQSSEWPADDVVTEQLTPLHVLIENNSDEPLRIRYQEFALVGPNGQYYAALPPIAAQADVEEAATAAAPAAPIDSPAFRHQGFFVAPAYHYGYRTIPVWARDFHHDPIYNRTYHQAYQQLNISEEELRNWALPEGVIEPGGSVSGYLYFEGVNPDLPQVHFRADLVNADSGRTLGTLSIPFDVKES